MTYLNAVILGVVQGIAEFLPVSSSGHLAVLQYFMHLGDVPLLFDVLLHIATLLVVCIIFYKRLWALIKSWPALFKKEKTDDEKENLRLTGVILVATFFTGLLGLFIEKLQVDQYVTIIYIFFIVTGIILLASRRWGGSDGYTKVGIKHGVITGIAQGFGVLPGISRSGITISAALLSGMTREKAGEYSFLISIPAILGALVLQLKDSGSLMSSVSTGTIAAGMISAFVVGLISLKVLLRLIRKGNLYVFSFYLIPLGIAGLIFLR